MTFRAGDKKPPGSGRKKGQVNSDTDEVKKLAKKYGADAIVQLNKIMTTSEDERARVAAAKEMLDRAYGRASGVLGVDPVNNKIEIVLIGDDAKL